MGRKKSREQSGRLEGSDLTRGPQRKKIPSPAHPQRCLQGPPVVVELVGCRLHWGTILGHYLREAPVTPSPFFPGGAGNSPPGPQLHSWEHGFQHERCQLTPRLSHLAVGQFGSGHLWESSGHRSRWGQSSPHLDVSLWDEPSRERPLGRKCMFSRGVELIPSNLGAHQD